MSGTVGRDNPAWIGAVVNGVFCGVGAVRSGPCGIGTFDMAWRGGVWQRWWREVKDPPDERPRKIDPSRLRPGVPSMEIWQDARSFGSKRTVVFGITVVYEDLRPALSA